MSRLDIYCMSEDRRKAIEAMLRANVPLKTIRLEMHVSTDMIAEVERDWIARECQPSWRRSRDRRCLRCGEMFKSANAGVRWCGCGMRKVVE